MIPTWDVLIPLYQEGLEALMPIKISVLCATCAHWTRDMCCEAFPEGIPAAIAAGTFDHRRPHAGDHGILYELAPNVMNPPELRS